MPSLTLVLCCCLAGAAWAVDAPARKTKAKAALTLKVEKSTSAASVPAAPTCRDYAGCLSAAQNLVKEGHCETAIQVFGQAIAKDPKNPWGWYHRAFVREALRDSNGAQSDYMQAQALEENWPDFKNRKKPEAGRSESFRWLYPGVKCVK
jgi:Flp pilus assembly protein TadD